MISRNFAFRLRSNKIALVYFFSFAYSTLIYSADWNVYGSGYWNDSANWTPTAFPNGVNSVAHFPYQGGIFPVVSLGAASQDITFGTISVDVGPTFYYTIAPGFSGNKLIASASPGPAIIHVNNLGFPPDITAPIQLNCPLTITGTGCFISGEISGVYDVTLEGSSVVYYSDNTYTGLTTVGNSTNFECQNPGLAFGGDLLSSGTVIFSAGDGIPDTAHVTVLDNSVTHVSELTMGSLDFLGGTFFNDTFPGLGIVLTGSDVALRMRNTTYDDSMKLTGGGSVVFDNTNNGTATLTYTLDLGGNNATVFNIANGTADVDMLISGVISNGGIVKTGLGVLSLTGANTYTGGTVIQEGTLIGNTSNLSGNITTNGELVFDESMSSSYNDVISGTGSLVKEGVGTLTLTNANTYTGGTTVSDGELLLNAPGMNAIVGNVLVDGGTLTLGAPDQIPDTSTVTVANGTFDLAGFAETIGRLNLNSGGTLTQGGALLTLSNSGTALSMQDTTISGNLALTGGGAVAFDSANNGTALISGNINLGGNSTVFGIANGTAPIDMSITGDISNGALVKNGAGTLSLTGSNSFTDQIIVNAGTLQGNTTSLTTNILNNAIVVFDQASNATYSGAITGSGAFVKQGVGTLILSGVNSYQGGTLINAGTLQGNTSSLQGDIIDNSFLIFDIAGSQTYGGGISGTGNVEKIGSGTLIFTGTHTYTGGTTVSAGTLQGNTNNLQGNITNNATLVFNQQTAGTYSGQLSGAGSLVKQGAGSLIFTASNSTGGVSVNQGALLINNSLSGAGTLTVAAGALLGGTGTVSKDTIIYGTLAPGNSIGTIAFVGNVTMATGSALEIELNPTTSDLVDVTGAYTIQPGVALNVIPLPGLYNGSPSYTIVQTTGGVTGTFSNTTSSSPLFKFTVDYAPLNISLNLEQVPFSVLFTSGNAGAVARCLDTFMASPCSNSTEVIESLQTIPTEKALKDALLQMQPSLFTSLAVVQENDLSYLRDALYNRMEVDLHSCCFTIQTEEKEKPHTFWLTALGAHTYQKNQNGEPGFVANSPGIFLGLDSKLGKMSSFGGGVAYAYTHVHWWEKRGKANVEGIYGTLYGRWASARAYIQGSLIGGYSFYSAHRNIAFGTTLPFKETASNHHNGWEGTANVRIALNYGCRFRFSPFIGADYFYVHENSYKESGAKSLNLDVESKNSNLLSSEIGIDLSHCFGSYNSFSPFVKISAIRESRFQGNKEHASLECGCDMTVSGLYPSRTLAGVAAGFNANMQNAMLSLFYQGKYGNSYSDNSWYLQYGLKF